MTLPVYRTIADMRAQVAAWKADGLRVGMVPTMGALHQGHLSLIDEIAPHCDRIITSIFVNPTQFAAHEDLDTYPRNEAADLAAVPKSLVIPMLIILALLSNAIISNPIKGFITLVLVYIISLPFASIFYRRLKKKADALNIKT